LALVVTAYGFIFMLDGRSSTFFLDGVQLILLASLLHFVFYSLVSYEFCRSDCAVGFDECACAMEAGKSRLLAGKLLVLISLTLPILVLNIITTAVGTVIAHAGMAFFQVLLHILLNLLILPAVGVLFGAVLAYGAKRGIAYIIIAVVTLLSTPLAGDWCVTIYKATGFSASVLTRLFPFMTPSTMLTSSNLAYGYSLRPYRIFAYAVWILVLCAVLFFYISKERGKKKRLFSAVVCLVAGLCLLPFVFRSNSDIIYDDMNSEGAGREISYYERNKITPPDACPEFKITSYDMELKLSNVLHAEVKVSVSPSNLDIYGFTLYHGYKVKEVKDESGRALKFEQTGDWIEVESAGETSSLTFSYSGYSNTHYSNGQGAALPGTFAYYPRAGYVVCADDNGYEYLTLDEPTQFDVKIKNRKKFFTNLYRTGKNTFSGKTTGLTIVGGFYKEDKIGDTNLVYTSVGRDVNEIKKVFSNLMQTYDRSFNTIMVAELREGKSMRDYGDTLIFTDLALSAVEMDYFLSQVPESRGDFGLQAYVFEYMRGTFEEYAEGDKSIGMNTRYVRVEAAADKYGDEYCRKAIDKYLYDESDTRTPDEFIDDLNRGTENVEN
jgi:Uncharacterized conserved protein